MPALDLIYMTIPSSLSFLLDSSLPPSSSQYSDTSLYIYHREALPHTLPDTYNTDHQNDSPNYLDLSSTRHLPPPSPLSDLSSPPSLRALAFSSVGNGAGSVDWPPTESVLSPADEDAQQDDGTGVQVRSMPPRLVKGSLTAAKTEENADNSILVDEKVIQSSIHEDSIEIILDCARPKSHDISILSSTSPDKPRNMPSNPLPAVLLFPTLPPLSSGCSPARVLDRSKLIQGPFYCLPEAGEEITDPHTSEPLASDDHPDGHPLPTSYNSRNPPPKPSLAFPPPPALPPINCSLAGVLDRRKSMLFSSSNEAVTDHRASGPLALDLPVAPRQCLTLSASERLIDMFLALGREVLSIPQRDRSGAPEIPTSLFPRRSPLRLRPPSGLAPFQLPPFQLPPRRIELARLIGEAPTSWVVSEPEATVLMESQLHQAIPVNGYDDGDVSMHSISLDLSSCHFSAGVQNGQVLTLAQPEARSFPQQDHDIEMAVDESMACLQELELSLQSIDTNGVLPCLSLLDISMPSARSLERPSERYTSELDRRNDWQGLQPIRTPGSQTDRRQQPGLLPSSIANHLQVCGGLAAVPYRLESLLTSRHGQHIPYVLSGLTRPGSPPLRICIPAELPNDPISKQSYQEAAAPQLSDVVMTEPNLTSLALSSPPDHFLPTAESRLSSLPIPDRRDAPLADSSQNHPLNHAHPQLHSGVSGVPMMVSEDAKSQPIKRFTTDKSASLPLPHLLPGLLEPITIHEKTVEDSLRVSQGPRKGRAANRYRIYSRPQDIPKLDYGLPEDFGEYI